MLGGVVMRSVLAETIDIVIEKSHGALEKISVDDVVIGVFFYRGQAIDRACRRCLHSYW